MRWDPRPDRFSFAGITIQEIDETGPIDDERLVLESEQLQEGPNLYAIDGWYYLMMAEGGTDWNHGIRMARSRGLYGPYEVDHEPLLTSRDDPAAKLAKAGHGELLRTPDGGWAVVHLASRPTDRTDGRYCVLGRETCIQPIVWADSWPRLAHGGHLPDGYRPHDVAGAYPVAFHDTFDQPNLDNRWITLRQPPDSSWLDLSSRPGWLRLKGRRGLDSQTQVSLVATRLLSTYCTITTEVEVEPASLAQAAGLALWYDRKGYHAVLVRGSEAGPQIVVATSNLDAYTELETGLLLGDWASVHLRAEVCGLTLRFAVSPDGVAWQQVGGELDLVVTSDNCVMRFTGTVIALLAIDSGPRSLWAAFSGVHVRA
ncbi:MAG: family 43 glycosylhydrolase, partial [Actinobacteria bacterium]|nr:family 43 glycosylhydrolase [Actinomycetota bacterium]